MIYRVLLSYYEHNTHRTTFKTNASLFFNRSIECGYQPKIRNEQFMKSAQKMQCKEKMHQRRLSDRRRDQDVQRILSPSPENLLLFADYVSNGTSNLFPFYQPSLLPILKMLHRMMCEKYKPSPPQSSPPNTILLLPMPSQRYFSFNNPQIL